MLSSRITVSTESVAGLMPITASPQPYNRPSRIEAPMPTRSSVGWFGCRRIESRPGRPSVLRNRVTTRHLLAARMRSWLRMSLLTAATISGVNPGAKRAEHFACRLVAQQPIAKLADRQVRQPARKPLDRGYRR